MSRPPYLLDTPPAEAVSNRARNLPSSPALSLSFLIVSPSRYGERNLVNVSMCLNGEFRFDRLPPVIREAGTSCEFWAESFDVCESIKGSS